MSELSDPAQLVGRQAEERLLSEDMRNLPDAVGRPELLPVNRSRRRIVGTGATLTAASLVIGVLLTLFGVVEFFADGVDVTSTLAFVVGLLLASTHWGWVHVAELTANSVEGHANAEVLDRRRQWRLEIEPYTRYEVTTSVQEDGSITIATVRFRAVPTGEDGFTFTREVKHTEVHSPDEPAAAVTDRAEHLRREAAIETERQRERYRIAADAYEAVLIDREDEEQRHAAQRAASEALSSQINANLRDPPLVE